MRVAGGGGKGACMQAPPFVHLPLPPAPTYLSQKQPRHIKNKKKQEERREERDIKRPARRVTVSAAQGGRPHPPPATFQPHQACDGGAAAVAATTGRVPHPTAGAEATPHPAQLWPAGHPCPPLRNCTASHGHERIGRRKAAGIASPRGEWAHSLGDNRAARRESGGS